MKVQLSPTKDQQFETHVYNTVAPGIDQRF